MRARTSLASQAALDLFSVPYDEGFHCFAVAQQPLNIHDDVFAGAHVVVLLFYPLHALGLKPVLAL